MMDQLMWMWLGLSPFPWRWARKLCKESLIMLHIGSPWKKKKKSFSAYISTVIVQTHLWSCCSTSCINTCFFFFSKANRGLRFECADLYLCEYVNLLKRQNTPIHSGGHVLMKNSYVISEKTELNLHRQYSLITQVWLTVNDSPETLKLCSYLIMFWLFESVFL